MKMDSNHIFISSYRDKEILKDLGGAWSAKQQAWRFPKSTYALDEIGSACPHLADTEAFQATYEKLLEGRNRLRQLKKASPTQTESDNLRPYQRQDVQYLTSIPHAGVFNQPRTGKTPTMIETIKQRKTNKNIIIAPASLIYNWKAEINHWHAQATVYMYTGTPKQRMEVLTSFQQHDKRKPCYLVMSKDTAKRDTEQLTFPHDVCVIDEAHYLRNSETAQSKAVYTIGYQATHRYALTGTPTVKHPVDVFGILKFLYPHKFTSYWQFVGRYFEILDNGFGKEIGNPLKHRIKELQDIIDAMSTQRLRKDVMQWLPDKQRHTHICHMESKQAKAYRQMLEDFFVKQGDVEVDTQNVLAQLTRLRQICVDPQLIGLDIPSAKTEALLEAIEDNTYDEPLVIMSMFTSYLNMLKPDLEKLGKRVGMITGEMSNQQKQQAAQDFQAGRIDILLCNIISAGTGFTLDRGEVIIFLDKAWNPSDNEQAEDRITPTRKERTHKHFIVSFICEGTVEDKIEKLLEKKESLTAVVNQCKTVADLRKFLVL